MNKDEINKILNKEITIQIRGYIRQMFKKYGLEKTEELINEIYKDLDKIRNMYLTQYRLILKYNIGE